MSEEVKTEIISLPVLTAEEKLTMRNFQIEMLTIQNRMRELEKGLSDFLNKVVIDKNVDKTKFGLNIDQLVFFPLKQQN